MNEVSYSRVTAGNKSFEKLEDTGRKNETESRAIIGKGRNNDNTLKSLNSQNS